MWGGGSKYHYAWLRLIGKCKDINSKIKCIYIYFFLARVGCPKGERVSKGNDSDKGVYLHRLQQNKRFKHKKLTLQTKYNDKSLTSNQPFVHICTYANRINNFSMVCRVIHFYVNLTASKSFKTNNRQ